MKLKRNNPCWCGSGERYKDCHLNREFENPPSLWELSEKNKKSFGKKDCLVPKQIKTQCNGKIVQAHTVSEPNLKIISRNGHVYHFMADFIQIHKNKRQIKTEPLGIKKASTFSGFCQYHDNYIFSPIEKQHFIASNEQCFLLGYRAIARELYLKKASLNVIENSLMQLDRGKSLEAQIYIQRLLKGQEKATLAGIRDMKKYKEIYDAVLLKKDFSGVRTYIIKLNRPPDIMCLGAIFPNYDFNGIELQNLYDLDKTHDIIAFAALTDGNNGYVIFTWLKDCDSSCISLIESLIKINNDMLPNALARFFFEYCENIYFSPYWWDNLANIARDKLLKRFFSGIEPPNQYQSSDCLKEDGLNIVNWTVISRKTNYS